MSPAPGRRSVGPSVVVLAALLGILVGAGVVWLAAGRGDETTAHRVRGVTTAVQIGATGIMLMEDGRARPEGYDIDGAEWQDCSASGCGPTHVETGVPRCVVPLSSGQRLELVVVDTRVPGAPGEAGNPLRHVVFVRCLSRPTHHQALS